MIVEVCDEGVCLEVGALAVPELFGLAFTAGGECSGCVRCSGGRAK